MNQEEEGYMHSGLNDSEPMWPVGVAVGLLAGGGFLLGAAVASACWLIAKGGC